MNIYIKCNMCEILAATIQRREKVSSLSAKTRVRGWGAVGAIGTRMRGEKHGAREVKRGPYRVLHIYLYTS